MKRLRPVDRQVIVITGASSGIGRATALLAARRGATVVAAARDEEGLATLVDEIAAAGGRASWYAADVGDAAAVARLAAVAVERHGRIDTWVNDAGVAIAGRLEDVPEADARRLFDVNFWGVVNGCRAALPALRANGGVLVNLGSITSDVASPFMGLYSASKQAIKAYTDALRIELMMERVPVAVVLVKPAPVATPILEHERNLMRAEATMPPPFYRPEDVARTILAAAEHPERDLYVGGVVRIGSVLARAFPNLADAGAALLGRRLFQNAAPPARNGDNLYDPIDRGATGGDTHGRHVRRSLYTALRISRLWPRSPVGALNRRVIQRLKRR